MVVLEYLRTYSGLYRRNRKVNMDYKHGLVIPNEDLPFCLFLFEGKDGDYHVLKRQHHSVEIFLASEGQVELFINNKRPPLRAADFVVVNSNEIHSIEMPDPNTTIVVQAPMSCFKGYPNEDGYVLFTKQPDEGNLNLIQLTVRIHRTYVRRKFAYELKAKSLFTRLLHLPVARFMRAKEDPGSMRHKRHLNKLSNITAYIKNNYNKDISLENLAATFGSSPAYLFRMFKRCTSVSYKTYLLDLRIEYGPRKVMNTSHNLTEVVLDDGSPDGRAFSKVLSKRYGCLPGEHHRMMEGEGDGPQGEQSWQLRVW